jgi:hypothetical protein
LAASITVRPIGTSTLILEPFLTKYIVIINQ